MLVNDLIKQVTELELIARKNAHSLLAGDYITSIAGKGLQFHEARKYIIGDPVRMIDWNMTARLGEAYVKTFLEEREREIVIALDASPSMFTGFQERTKIEFAIEMAATIAFSAIKSRDKVGYVIFNDTAIEVGKPTSGKVQLFRMLKSFLTHAETERENKKNNSDIRAVLKSLQKFKKSRFAVFIISDFIDKDIPEDLKYARAEHDLNMLHIYDPLEYTSNSDIFFPAYSPEEGSIMPSVIQPGQAGSLAEMKEYLKTAALKYNITYSSFDTRLEIGTALKEFFHFKKRMAL